MYYIIMPSALVLSPHTDDGELGCGGTIAKLIENGWHVKILCFTACGRDVLKKEAHISAGKLGVSIEILDFFVRQFHRDRQEILQTLYDINKNGKYQLIFTPVTTDIHQDHNVITKEAKRAFRSNTILGYELPWNNLSVTLNGFISLDSRHVDKKIDALDSYNSQKDNLYFNSTYFKSVLFTRGIQLGTEFAEGYEVIKIKLDDLL